MSSAYDELRSRAARMMRAERPGHTLQGTALVHEVYLKLIDRDDLDWTGRTQFMGAAATCIRRILIDHARRKRAAKRV